MKFSSVWLFSPVQLFVTPWIAAGPAFLSIINFQNLLKLMSIKWCHPTISSSVITFFSCLQSFPASGSLAMSQFFAKGGQSIGSFSFGISPSDEYSELISFRMDWLDSCSPKDSQESSPTPLFKSNNSLVLSFLYNPTLTSIHDYWKHHSFY